MDDHICPVCFAEMQEVECDWCSGQGWYEITVTVHDPRCDGTCSIGCPVPSQGQAECGLCGSTGKRLRCPKCEEKPCES
jgi:hypothetical protein